MVARLQPVRFVELPQEEAKVHRPKAHRLKSVLHGPYCAIEELDHVEDLLVGVV